MTYHCLINIIGRSCVMIKLFIILTTKTCNSKWWYKEVELLRLPMDISGMNLWGYIQVGELIGDRIPRNHVSRWLDSKIKESQKNASVSKISEVIRDVEFFIRPTLFPSLEEKEIRD